MGAAHALHLAQRHLVAVVAEAVGLTLHSLMRHFSVARCPSQLAREAQAAQGQLLTATRDQTAQPERFLHSALISNHGQADSALVDK